MDLTPGQKPQKRKSDEANSSDQPKQAKKVVLNRTSSTTDATHNITTESIQQSKIEEKKVIKLSELSAKEVSCPLQVFLFC